MVRSELDGRTQNFEPDVDVIQLGRGLGKTTALLREVCRVMASGEAARVTVWVPNSQRAQDWYRLLGEHGVPTATSPDRYGVFVSTPARPYGRGGVAPNYTFVDDVDLLPDGIYSPFLYALGHGWPDLVTATPSST